MGFKKKTKLSSLHKLVMSYLEMTLLFLVLTGVFHKLIMNGKFLFSVKDIMCRAKIWAVYKGVWDQIWPSACFC